MRNFITTFLLFTFAQAGAAQTLFDELEFIWEEDSAKLPSSHIFDSEKALAGKCVNWDLPNEKTAALQEVFHYRNLSDSTPPFDKKYYMTYMKSRRYGENFYFDQPASWIKELHEERKADRRSIQTGWDRLDTRAILDPIFPVKFNRRSRYLPDSGRLRGRENFARYTIGKNEEFVYLTKTRCFTGNGWRCYDPETYKMTGKAAAGRETMRYCYFWENRLEDQGQSGRPVVDPLLNP